MATRSRITLTRTFENSNGFQTTDFDYKTVIMHTVVMTQFKTLFDLKCMNIRATLKSDLEYCVPFLQLHRFDQTPSEGRFDISLARGYEDTLTFTLNDHHEDKEHYLLECKGAITMVHVDEAVNMAAHILSNKEF